MKVRKTEKEIIKPIRFFGNENYEVPENKRKSLFDIDLDFKKFKLGFTLFKK